MSDEHLEFFFRLPPEEKQKSYWQGTEVAGCIAILFCIFIGILIGVGIYYILDRL